MICEDEIPFYESFEDRIDETEEEYNEMDTNKDGKISSREYGDNWLDIAIEEKGEENEK